MNYLITADLHLRDDRPACRLDDWWESQKADLQFIVDAANKNKARLLIAGDIFHRPKVSEKLLLMTWDILSSVEAGVTMIAGNHDLPNHMIERLDECSYGVLAELFKGSGKGRALKDGDRHSGILGYNWRCDINSDTFKYVTREEPGIALTHLTIATDIPIAAEKTVEPEVVFSWKGLKGIDLIVAGDIHNSTLYTDRKIDGRALLIPGCINNQASDFEGYQPMLHLWKKGIVTPIKIPQDNARYTGMVEVKEEYKSSRIADAIGQIGDQSVHSLFRQNVKATKCDQNVMQAINSIFEKAGEDRIW